MRLHSRLRVCLRLIPYLRLRLRPPLRRGRR